MSTTFSIYIGPFAEWLVPKTNHQRIWNQLQSILDEFDASAGKNGCLHRYDFEKVVVVGGTASGRSPIDADLCSNEQPIQEEGEIP
jgi:hypothetical protein